MTHNYKKKEKLCPMNHPYSRENGECCLGGTHRIHDTSVENSASQAQVVEFADGKPAKNPKKIALSNNGCKHGYMFDREEGQRCQGGTHYTDVPSDEMFSDSTDKGCGAVARNNVIFPTGKCKNGFQYNREERQRCYGGTHYVDAEQDEKFSANPPQGDGTLKDKWWKKHAPECQHGYRYGREDGTRCEGGSHHFKDGRYNPAVHGPNAGKPRTQPIPHECPDGYRFERENGSRCKGGSHFRYYE